MSNVDDNALDPVVLELDAVKRTFRQGRSELHVLNGVDLKVREGEIVALAGPSGSGKSTLLHVAGLLERPDGGEVRVKGEDAARIGDDRRTTLRRHTMGFIYQYHHLLAEFSALENIIIPQIMAGMRRGEAKKRAQELLDYLGLSERASHRPARLSGGEQQRVAIARALANAPNILLADEPTGNLDPHTADDVFQMFMDLARDAGLAAVVATHNSDLAKRMDRIVRLEEGILV